jgi:uncharacterized phage-associated protein
MHFRLNLIKTIQAAAELLRQEPGKQMSRIRLLKLLYIADRESLKETGRPVTWDTWVAMRHGPVLSHFYDVIKGEDVGSTELNRFVDQQGYQLQWVNDPGRDQLNRYEIRKLHELSNRYRDMTEWDIVDETHAFKEWIKNAPGESSRPIPLTDVLEALGMTADQIQSVCRDLENVKRLEAAFHHAH